jgi:hypothetical protein
VACRASDEFDEWFADLNEDDQAELIAKVELLKHLGPKVGPASRG